MRVFENFVAAIASVATYRLVDSGLRALSRRVLERDVPTEAEPHEDDVDVIEMGRSLVGQTPSVEKRHTLVRVARFAGAVAATTAAFELRERLFEGVFEDPEDKLVTGLALSVGSFVALDVVVKPALGLAEPTGRGRRFVSHLTARGMHGAVRQLLE